MATNPTKRIRKLKHASPFTMGPDDLLDRLAHLEPSPENPYLTVSLDWGIEGTSPAGREEPEEVKRSQDRSGTEEGSRWRPSIEVMERELNALIDEHGPRGEIFDSLTEDKENIRNFLDNELDPAAQGVYIVANAAKGVFEAAGVAMSIETRVTLAPTPSMYKLVRLIEDNPIYAVLLADQKDATLSFISYGQRRRTVTLEASGYPRRVRAGGWSHRRFQARAGERVDAFAGDVANETQDALDQLGVEALIIAGDEVITSALEEKFHETVKERIVDTIRMDIRADEQDIIEATAPIAERAEREREAAAMERLQNAIGANGLGTAGPGDTLRALQSGQVDELILVDSFEGTGWADYSMHLFGADNMPTEHPLGGDVTSIVSVDLRDEMVRLALMTDAEVDIIHSDVPVEEIEGVPDAGEGLPVTPAANTLIEMGGVGATLRFTLDETPMDQGV